MEYNNYPDNEMNEFAEDYLNRYYVGNNNEDMEFPDDLELDNLYSSIHMEYMEKHGNQAHVSQGFDNLLWLGLIGGLFRRFPYYRGRCRYDRRYCRRGRRRGYRRGYGGGYGGGSGAGYGGGYGGGFPGFGGW